MAIFRQIPFNLDIIASWVYNTGMNEQTDNDLDHLLFKRFSNLGHSAIARLDAALSPRGLSVAKLSVLRELCEASEPLPLGQLAERLTCAKSNVTQLVDRLEQEGLVRRVPHSGDRRCIRATITQEGRRRCELGLQIESQIEQHLFRNLSESEKKQLAVLLAEMHSETD